MNQETIDKYVDNFNKWYFAYENRLQSLQHHNPKKKDCACLLENLEIIRKNYMRAVDAILSGRGTSRDLYVLQNSVSIYSEKPEI